MSNAPPATTLHELFTNYAGPTGEIDGKTFAKITRDSGVINRHCTLIDIDIFFAKVKQKGMRKINYSQFYAAVDLCATKRGQSTKTLADMIVAAGGPKYIGTSAKKERLHDDKSLYTGTTAKYSLIPGTDNFVSKVG